MKASSLVLLSTVAVALGGFLLGFDTAVIAGATSGMTAAYRLTTLQVGLTVSCALWGTVIGGLLASSIGKRFGARVGLQWMGVLYLISALGCALAWSWPSLLAFRLIGGLGIGGSSVFSPMYIAEIAPGRWRGRLVACFQVAVVIGILLAYASNSVVGRLVSVGLQWRYDLAASAVPAIFFIAVLFLIPDSPRWLLERGRTDEAMRVFARMGEPEEAVAAMAANRSVGLTASHGLSLFTRKHRRVIWIAISIGALNQLSGINAILYYLNDIFAQAGFSAASANLQAIAIGAANLLFTLLAMFFIDSMGRKFLLIVGSGGMAGGLLAISRIFATGSHRGSLLWLLITYIAFFAFSQGTVVWVYLSEIFPPGLREQGQSLGTLALWITNGIIAAIYPLVAKTAGQYPFLLFSAMMMLQLGFTIFVLPETKGVTLETVSDNIT